MKEQCCKYGCQLKKGLPDTVIGQKFGFGLGCVKLH